MCVIPFKSPAQVEQRKNNAFCYLPVKLKPPNRLTSFKKLNFFISKNNYIFGRKLLFLEPILLNKHLPEPKSLYL